jgi:hypothetical protein
MEVHHHPDVEKKGLKEYILEGLMIFIAVMMGFFAESLREHLADNGKEKEFVASIKEDIAVDTSSLRYIISYNLLQFQKLDSLYTIVGWAIEGKPYPVNRMYYLTFKYGYGLAAFNANERTISQIKNTGGFALIKSHACRDSINQYYYMNDNAITHNAQGLKEWTEDLDKTAQKIFDYKYSKTFWFDGNSADVYLSDSLHLTINNDKQVLKEYANKIRSLMMMVHVLMLTEKIELRMGKNLIGVLNKEYHLKN